VGRRRATPGRFHQSLRHAPGQLSAVKCRKLSSKSREEHSKQLRPSLAAERILKAGREAAIYPQIDAGYVSCDWAGEKGDGIRNFVQLTNSADGNLSK
jgi:hypothetical protein